VDTWIDIRRKARACHEKALHKAKGDRSAKALIAEAIKADDLEVRRVDPGKTFGPGVYGLLERANGIVNVLKGQEPAAEAVVIAHEIGHFHLHRDPTNEVTSRPASLGGDPVESGAGKVEGYSPRERKEVQADIFAGEFLCPSNWLREQFVSHGKRPEEIAHEVGVPRTLVLNQLIRALLLPPLTPAPPTSPGGHAFVLDESQSKAAHWKGHVLVDAGPGTGKTRTLVARVAHLLKSTGPASILALTFSNKAADEMRERISSMNADASIEMWAGTFHAFGLELIQKWPSGVGRTSKVRPLDEAGQLELLEEHLDELPLRHYQNLYEPAYELVHILRAISRCKDEGVSPGEYLAEAQAMLSSAATDEERELAERAVEVGEAYAVYEKALANADAVDFGDLILMAAKLAEENAAVKAYIAGFKHVLVDEYQDVNFASARLLRAICAAGAEAWVVADQRQSIYRFRGAAPTNVERFAKDFGGMRHSLNTNYRSFAPIVRTFQQFSSTMGQSGAMTGTWTAQRSSGGEVSMTTAPTVSAEAEAIRDHIEALRAKGVPYSEQAILARTHLTLARITELLEQLGVPLVYLGDLFERDEIRTLLSLVSIDAEPGGIGLMRVATLPEYNATRTDALTVIGWAHANQVRISEALTRASEIAGLTAEGRDGLIRLGSELHGLSNASPWVLLTTWLFERSNHLLPLLGANNALGQQKLIAIYHLLKFCSEQAAAGQSSRKGFLDRIRRLEVLNYDSSFRRVASEATDMDAVRVMTIHGSKGLEFRAVHFPALATRYMPTIRQGVRCPPPPALARLSAQPDDHDAEEQSLFFVGLSRARDFLFLSRAERYTTTNASASKFIPAIQSAVSHKTYRGSGKVYTSPVKLYPPEASERYDERDLAIYMQCPARYRYMVIEGLRGGRDESAYVSFHRCVYSTVRWLEAERENGNTVKVAEAIARLSAEWEQSGPVTHPFEPYYRRAAEGMVRSMVDAIATEVGQYERAEWQIPLGRHQVVLTPDRVLITPAGTVRVQRVRTGRETKSEPDKPIYALLRQGAVNRYAGKQTSVEIFYLANAKALPTVAKNDAKAVEKYTDAIAAIEQGNFQPKPDARVCPNCPCYFICRG
jgi:superfamily I DNA/RNA helicase/Zn-dependent peptidase ImmA (M78 family)